MTDSLQPQFKEDNSRTPDSLQPQFKEDNSRTPDSLQPRFKEDNSRTPTAAVPEAATKSGNENRISASLQDTPITHTNNPTQAGFHDTLVTACSDARSVCDKNEDDLADENEDCGCPPDDLASEVSGNVEGAEERVRRDNQFSVPSENCQHFCDIDLTSDCDVNISDDTHLSTEPNNNCSTYNGKQTLSSNSAQVSNHLHNNGGDNGAKELQMEAKDDRLSAMSRLAFPWFSKYRRPSAAADTHAQSATRTHGSFSQTLPINPPKGILHPPGHTFKKSASKRLTFQLAVSPDNSPVSRLHNNKLVRAITFHSRRKMAHNHSQDPRQCSGMDDIAVTVTSGSRSVEPAAERGPSQRHREGSRYHTACHWLSSLKDRIRRWMQLNDSIEGKEIRNTIVVGVAFQLIFTAHFAIQNLQSSLHEEEYLGASALGCLYASSIFSSIFAPTIIGLLGTKGCLSLAWLCHILYTLAQFYPTWQTLVPASILLGALTGPTWTSQGLYVSACAFSFSKRSSHSPYTILSRFNGLFFTLFETRQILGNLLSSVVLRHGLSNTTEGVTFKFCGPDDCPSSENVTDIEEPDPVVLDIMLGIYMALQILALVLTVVLVTPLSRSEWSARAPVWQSVTSWFQTLIGSKMFLLVPFMIFQAMEQGILLSEYTKSYISCPIGIHNVGFIMATHGGTSAVFVFVFSRLARHTGRLTLFLLAAVCNLALLVALFGWTPSSDQQALIYSFPVLWGIGEGIWQTQTNSMIAVVFSAQKEPAFANYQTWRAVGYTLTFSFHSFLCVSTKIAIALGILIVGMILYVALEMHLRWKERIQVPADPTPSQPQSSLPRPDLISQPPTASQLTPAARRQDSEESGLSRSSFHAFLLRHHQEGRMSLDETYPKPGESALQDSSYDIVPTTHSSCDVIPTAHSSYDVIPTAHSSYDVIPTAHSSYDVIPTAHSSYDVIPTAQSSYDAIPTKRSSCDVMPTALNSYDVSPIAHRRNAGMVPLPRSFSEGDDRWARYNAWNSGSLEEYTRQSARQHSWHQPGFQDEGELQVLWTDDDVFVF